jgi:ribosomal protein S18 acetylase RimI-like enzyme
MPNTSCTTIRFAQDTDPAQHIADLVNDAYRIGEKGIIQEPFQRITASHVEDLIDKQELLVLVLQAPIGSTDDASTDMILGCVQVTLIPVSSTPEKDPSQLSSSINKQDSVLMLGEWGCLAVHGDYQNQGFGRQLIQAAEDYLVSQQCTTIHIHLLTPSHREHDHKNRLYRWYTSCWQYDFVVKDNAEASTQKLVQNQAFGDGRFVLATDADLITLSKPLTVRNTRTPLS